MSHCKLIVPAPASSSPPSVLSQVGPAELRRALENSAQPVAASDPFAQGFGLINAPAAVAYAKERHGKLGQDVAFKVTLWFDF